MQQPKEGLSPNAVMSCNVARRQPRRGGRAAKCGGLLNTPALFALADFHVFSVIYAALSCAAMSTFAGHSAPRVHQEFVIAIRPRTGLRDNFRDRLAVWVAIKLLPTKI